MSAGYGRPDPRVRLGVHTPDIWMAGAHHPTPHHHHHPPPQTPLRHHTHPDTNNTYIRITHTQREIQTERETEREREKQRENVLSEVDQDLGVAHGQRVLGEAGVLGRVLF